MTEFSNTFTSELLPANATYVVTETVVDGWDLTGLVCTSTRSTSTATPAAPSVSIELAAGDTVTCTFTNTQRGSITIVKDAVPDHPQDFTFSGDLGDFTLDDDPTMTLEHRSRRPIWCRAPTR